MPTGISGPPQVNIPYIIFLTLFPISRPVRRQGGLSSGEVFGPDGEPPRAQGRLRIPPPVRSLPTSLQVPVEGNVAQLPRPGQKRSCWTGQAPQVWAWRVQDGQVSDIIKILLILKQSVVVNDSNPQIWHFCKKLMLLIILQHYVFRQW